MCLVAVLRCGATRKRATQPKSDTAHTDLHVHDTDGIPSRKQVESLIDTTILTEVLKETRQMRDAFMEQNKTIENLRMENERQHRIIEEARKLGNNITNVMNNNFNINVFLNEHCKNALNLSDFVNTIVVQIEDLDKTKSIGFVKGVTDIIVRNFRQLDVYSRPIHCSDPVQEIMYVKNDDTWHQDKDDADGSWLPLMLWQRSKIEEGQRLGRTAFFR